MHLGNGLFVTAAHVVDGAPALLRGCPPSLPRSTVTFQGSTRLAELVGSGTAEVEPVIGLRYLGGRDLGLLRLPGGSGPAAHPCAFNAAAGETVIVASPWRVFRARVLGTMREDRQAFGGYAEIAARLEPGESGAGVFDAAEGCLLGVVSHRDDPTPDRTRVVLASALRAFLEEEHALLRRPASGVAVPLWR
ncbi:trypsin-like peptidase [Humitalea rosea]|uniref:Trypsin-like peptidase n=1 Tax=Humitalea rosea TaxID=990373 RepID=A0A2W7I601_9PROT|nr:trypsin-like peptidase domain-containing protein [Humitalea rosea]PZW42301.1 trypsin-like peptidase [Humitalea rosea]